MTATRLTIFRVAALTLTMSGMSLAHAQTELFSQPMMAGGGTLRNSQLWIDPSGENDSDNDAIAWASFTLQEAGEVTQISWSGQALPSLGFEISFYNQDPNTVASQPHIFGAGSGPLSHELHASPAVQSLGGNLYTFTVNLDTPMTFAADTRYFVSIVGRIPVPYAPWGWAQATGPGSTFWWSRGAHMYFNIAGARAFVLRGTPLTPQPCPGDADGSNTVNFTDLNLVLSAWNTTGPQGDIAPFPDGDGVVNFDDLNEVLTNWGGSCG